VVKGAAKGEAVSLKLFIPCFMDQCGPEIAGAVVNLLNGLGVPWAYPEDQTCCGQFAYTVGDLTTARRLKRHFLRVFGNAEVILCPSASCTYMVRQGYPQLAHDDRERREIEDFTGRVWELSQWLADRGPLPWTPHFKGALVFHHSCKARQLGVLAGAARLLEQVAGLNVLTVSPYYSCCGFGGAFSVVRPGLSQTIGEAYLEAVRATGAAGLVSLDYSCLLHLKDIAAGRGWDLKFLHLSELLTLTD
jgi:L-lactate dehydrogenase complex protein LldE